MRLRDMVHHTCNSAGSEPVKHALNAACVRTCPGAACNIGKINGFFVKRFVGSRAASNDVLTLTNRD